ncbi:CDP-glycerol glycerophosphotransferase family protein [Enterococcus montenegrensis]|nr:CDP-glycerol glycerophosphotransferase family protein [Enterococcus montenegrensis]MDT2738572.1 CDP-glycerol glycerophosphotransferase family protein [Enterococcus canintestini]WHA08352.1 CDP-glycerol glycerophosphotransferase family protein [Enterococcus montenegrensis]
MKIGIIGFNIFGVGGTSRSNINLIQELQQEESDIVFFNTSSFSEEDVKELVDRESLRKNVSFRKLNDILMGEALDSYILTRESLFVLARALKKTYPNSKIIGEVHAPIYNVEIGPDFAADAIDIYRVSTINTAKLLKQKIGKNNVIPFSISIRHVLFVNEIKNKPSKPTNFFIFSRFDETSKDIAYAISLMRYLVKEKRMTNYKLFINGQGIARVLYKNLINAYGLNDNVFINYEPPTNYIYLSTSRAETFGYSIMEALGQGMPAILYPGDDGVLKEVYGNLKSVAWLTKDIKEDAQTVIRFIEEPWLNQEYQYDLQYIKTNCITEGYGHEYIDKVIKNDYSVNFNGDVNASEIVNEIYSSHLGNQTLWGKIVKKGNRNRYFRRISQSKKIQKYTSKITNFFKKSTTNPGNSIIEETIKDNYIFIESFHGKNFSGDPKYIALAIKERYPDVKIFVSSINQLVDMEIYQHHFTPIRTGSNKYVSTFRQSRLIIVNGNTLDKVGKREGQIFFQTWHGFPLKKMVADLENEKEKQTQLKAFLPRMMKWDYLLSSSSRNTRYITSAFQLEKNPNLKILEVGAPKNTYLIENNINSDEIERLHLKYFGTEPRGFKYVLYCPTWRQEKRDDLSALDLKKIINLLPINYHLIVKLHPNEAYLRRHYANLDSRIHCFYNDITDIQELYLLSETLITDYSSAMFDFAHTRKKIIVLQEDKQQYVQKVGWYFDLEDLTGLIGKSYSEEELVREIIEPEMDFYNEIICDVLMSNDTDSSTNELIEILAEDIFMEAKNGDC